MADYRFSFMNLSKIESPNWMAPEGETFFSVIIMLWPLLPTSQNNQIFFCLFNIL